MNTVPAKELSNISMVAGNETKYKIVIDNGVLKEWVGFGWLELRKTNSQDLKRFPVVEREKGV